MKATLCLVLLATISLAFAKIDGATSNFLVGEWFSTGVSNPFPLDGASCCMPRGTIRVYVNQTNDTYVLLNATEWVGKLCAKDQLNISNNVTNYKLVLPFLGNATYNNISNGLPATNNLGIDFTLLNGDFSQTYSNNSQAVSFSIEADFSGTTATADKGECSTKIVKFINGGAILRAAGAGIIALVGLLMF